jgi:cobalt-zinc-cadmium efflux system outer membrane protein
VRVSIFARRAARSFVIAVSLLPTSALAAVTPAPIVSEFASPTLEPLEASTNRFEEPQGALSLETALALALAQSPDLAVFSWNVRAVEARTLQAGLRPNPQLLVDVQDVAGTGAFRRVDETQLTVTLSRLIELGGKRTQRLRGAALEHDLAAWDYESKRVEVFTATAQAFIEVLAQQQHQLLAEQTVGLAQQVVNTVVARVNAGSSSRAELVKAEVALSGAKIDQEQRDYSLVMARRRLAVNWGSAAPVFERAVGNLAAPAVFPDLGDLQERLEQNPDLARWGTEVLLREATVDLELSRAVPDVTVGAGIRALAGPDESSFVAEFSLPLPVSNRNQGAILEARRRSNQARAQRHATELRLRSELLIAHQAIAGTHAQINRLQKEILPGASQAFNALRSGYREGRFSYLEVLDAQRTLNAARAQQIQALADYHRGVTVLERLVGESVVNDTPVTNEQGSIR